jgi:anti-sigma regulatory factor (Ser/Thr protein kinase)
MIAANVTRQMHALPDVMRLSEVFFAKSEGDPKIRFAVELALEEMFTNMVKYNGEGEGDIRVELDRTSSEIVVRLTDFDAPRFDPFTEAREVDIDRSLEDRSEGGLGIHLVKKMMDRFEYSHHDRTAMVTLYKRV